jgi:cell division control protein 24
MASTVVPTANGGVVASTNIINQRADASRSLYQICIALKQRLALVPDFEGHLEIMDRQAMLGEDYNPVESLWNLLRSGDPLLTIYNSTRPDKPLDPNEITRDAARRPKVVTFKFIEVCMKQLQIPATECFIVSDLMNEDTTGFMKVCF